MLTKNNFPSLQAGYMSATGKLAHPHPSPCDFHQVTEEISKLRIPNAGQANAYPHPKVHEVFGTLVNTLRCLPSSPWCNGQMPSLTLNPKLFLCGQMANQYGLTPPNSDFGIDPNRLISFVYAFQDQLQTHHYNAANQEWEATLKASVQKFTDTFKVVTKAANGFTSHEFVITTDTTQIGSPQLNRAIEAVSSGFINSFEDQQLLAIFLKKEPILNNQVRLRFIILLRRDFMDDPVSLNNLGFFERIKLDIERAHGYQLFYDTSLLNKYMTSNLFHKKSRTFKEQMAQLKVYLVGTDSLYRICGTDSTFSVLYLINEA